MRKCITIILVLLSVLGMYTKGQAKPLYDKYWFLNGFTMTLARIPGLWGCRTQRLSPGRRHTSAPAWSW